MRGQQTICWNWMNRKISLVKKCSVSYNYYCNKYGGLFVLRLTIFDILNGHTDTYEEQYPASGSFFSCLLHISILLRNKGCKFLDFSQIKSLLQFFKYLKSSSHLDLWETEITFFTFSTATTLNHNHNVQKL